MGDTVLVTGCSTGIGRATARRFCEAGWTVYATSRDRDDIRDLHEVGCRTAELDVTDDTEVIAVVDRIFDEQGRLDCLVNNAGYGQFGPVEDVPMDGVVEQFEVNTFGPLRLVRAVLPQMRDRGRGTVVNVTAGVGALTLPGIGVYNASKHALVTATDALRQEAGDEVDVVAVEPGFVATDFYDRALAELETLDRTPAYADLYRVLDRIGIVQRGGPGINSPERVADEILNAATAETPSATYRVGGVATALTTLGQILKGRLRAKVSRAGVSALSSDIAQKALDRIENRQSRHPDQPGRPTQSEGSSQSGGTSQSEGSSQSGHPETDGGRE